MMRITLCAAAVATALIATNAAIGQTERAKAGASPPAASPSATPVDTGPIVAEGVVNAPAAEVWKVFSTGEGFTKLGPAKADVDLRVGGLIRSHYKPDGVLGDEGTISNRILAYEPGRMMTIQIDKPPKGFPFMDVYTTMWTVITITDLGEGRSNLRCAAYGFGADEQSQKMREFFRTGNEWTVKTLQSKFDSGVKPKDISMAHSDAPATPTSPIDVSRVVKAPRDDVYRMYTTSAGWKDFFEVDTRIEPVPGGKFEILFGPAGQVPEGQRGSEGCTVLSLVPGEMFSHTWNAPPNLAFARNQRTWVVVTFEEVSPTTTKVRLRHYGFEELSKQHPEHAEEFARCRAYFAKNWPMVLGAMAGKFEPDMNK
jgi:uncharacterized protein YndB with AHSA1/START domain